ncbi:MAG: LON peptidase substrate-binding domain-containing protein [Actinomycetota bacterium]|nr:LON peptidase substrate-binding domain-containing protein [Actinomycetota bacterium]
MVLPLRIFEPRYLRLMERLLSVPEGTPAEFGVVAIRQGWEVGADGVQALYRIGCTAVLHQAAELPDGTYEVVAIGTDRFRVDALQPADEPYLQAQIERLADEVGPAGEAKVLAQSVQTLYGDYVAALAGTEQPGPLAGVLAELPDDPLLLAALVAATSPLELGDQQALLAAPDGVSRLRAELRLLKREVTMLRRLRAVPIALAELQVPLGLN